MATMQEPGNERNEHDEAGLGQSGNQFVLTGNGSMKNNIQHGTQNTQINAETFHDNRSNIDRQYVSTLQLRNARIQQITQNSFSGSISVRASTIASNSSRLTVLPAAASLLRSADRLHRTFIKCSVDESDVLSSSPFSLFRAQLQQIQDALKPGQNNEHRLDLISFQDYFLVLVQAFQLFTDIDQNIADLDLMQQGPALDHELRAKHFHAQDVDELNEQLKHQCDVLTNPTYAAAQQSARKVTELGDRHAERYSRDLAEIDRRIRHAQKLLSSMTNQIPQLEKLANTSQTISTTDTAAQAEWERELLNSPAYSRALQLAANNRFSISSRQSTARSEAWPSLDLISLANISIISVVDLPVVWDSLSMLQRSELGSIMEIAHTEYDQPSLQTRLPSASQEAQQGLSEELKQLSHEPTLVQRVLMQTAGLRALTGRQAIWHALATGDEHKFRELLLQGFNPLFRDRKTRTTPLEEATKLGKADFVNMILAQSKPDQEQWFNALYGAIIRNQIGCVQAFVAHGVKDQSTWKGRSPYLLELAASRGRWQIVRLLLPAIERRAINEAVYEKPALALAIEGNHLAVVEILLADDRVNVNVSLGLGTPLMTAIYLGRSEIARALISSGRSNLRQLDVPAGNALSHAFDQKNDVIAKLILRTDAQTLRDAVVAVFDQKIEYLTDYAQNLVCDYIVHEMDGSLFRTAVLSQNTRMVLALLGHPSIIAENVVQQRLEHAMTTGDLPLVCTLRNYIWNDCVPSSGRLGVSLISLRTAAKDGRYKELLEVLVAIDRKLVLPQVYISSILELINCNGKSSEVELHSRRLDQYLTYLSQDVQYHDCDARLLLRTKNTAFTLHYGPAPSHWLELPAHTLSTQ